MQSKEVLLVVGGALLLTNLSIIGTLFATGYFDNGEEVTTEPEEEIAAPEPPPPPPKKRALHSMAKAMYLCEDKLNASTANQRVSYQFNTVASRFDEAMDSYSIFIDTRTASRASAPEQAAEVICEVSAGDMAITNYQVMKN